MDRKTFDGSMTRLMGFYKLPTMPAEKAHFSTYMDSLYEAVQRMDPFLFDTVTKELSKTLSRGQRPVPSQFYAVYEKLRDQQPKKVEKCESCDSTGWVTTWLMNHETAEADRFVKPCPLCRDRHPYKNAPQRPGWIELDEAPEQKPTEATKNFLADFFGIEAKTPEEALAIATKMYREKKITVADLVTVLKRKQSRAPGTIDHIKRMNELSAPMFEKLAEQWREQTATAVPPPVEGSPAPQASEEYEVEE